MATGERFGSIWDGGTTLGLGPAELLDRFSANRDEAAFSALVAHHGPMVLATCRRILPERADADDAFQATFLVLAKKASSIRDPDRLAPWLHGVARRVSVRARSVAARRRAVEGEGQGDVAVAPAPDDAAELRSILDEELARLPEKYRAPLVLCYLEGLTHDEAAGQLAWPVGTVRSRLAGGRDRLRSRLARRGYASGALAVLSPATLPSAAVSRLLQAATLRLAFTPTAGQVATSAAALLAQGALTSMFFTKIQTIALLTVATAGTLAAGTAGVVAAQSYALTPTEANPGLARTAEAAQPPSATSAQPGAALRDQPSSVDPAQPDPAAPALQKELDAAKARIKALEAELAKYRQPSVHGIDERSATPSFTAPSFTAGVNLPRPPEPPATPDVPPAEATSRSTTRYVASADAPATPPQTPTPPSTTWASFPFSKANVNDTWAIPFVGNRVLVSPAERDRVTIVNTVVGRKATFKDPENIKKIVPVYHDNLVGLYLEGPRVTQVVAFSVSDNAWSTQPLREPLTGGKVNPVIGQRMVRYFVGHFIYAFSPEANRWAILETKEEVSESREPKGLINTEDGMILPEGDILHSYNTQTGVWTHINTKDDK